jgi:hypothetical protein
MGFETSGMSLVLAVRILSFLSLVLLIHFLSGLPISSLT